jgi:hypothetical protein
VTDLPDIDWKEVKKALCYLESLESFYLMRSAQSAGQYTFDPEHYKKLAKWVMEMAEQSTS